MRPMVAGTELPQVQEIGTADLRALAEHKPPGKDGSLLQDLGRAPTTVTLAGVATDPKALELVETLKKDLRTGKSVPFVSDITTDCAIERVLIDDLQVRQLAGTPDRYAYVVTLREYIEPVEPASTDALDADILGEAGDLLDGIVDGLDLALPFATGLERFVQPLTELLGRLTEANKTQ
ncbi:hypothetical protein [Actinopolymorpha alba]|uniref:hypothetical protein n=1 Tax=Actinopolymorpha alba TaxID=533267 RepID=UPI000380A2A1|nr:hypothetical protein [Actinopolymorpha alba]